MNRIFTAFRNEIWTYVIVTAVTLLVWFWAASETREQDVLYPTLRFTAASPADQKWLVTPPDLTVTLRVEGSNRAIQEASAAVRGRLNVEIPPPGDSGTVDLTLAQVLAQQPDLREAGVSIVSVEPPFVELRVDEIVDVKAPVRVELPGVQTEGEIVVEPREVTVSLPKRKAPPADGTLVVDAQVGPASNLMGLEPGRTHTLKDIPVRLPESLRGEQGVSVSPATVKTITFTVRSRIRQTTVDAVRVQVSGDPQNFSEYVIEIPESVLTGVVVSAESDLIQLIDSGAAKVAAILPLSTRDLEEGITSKRISHFRAIITGTDGRERGAFVQASVDGEPAPLIQLRITKRDDG